MNKITKLLLLTLALTLVIGMTVAFAASAEDETLPTIVGKNILYTDMTAIQIAVDADTVDADDVKLVADLNGVKANYTTYTIGKEGTAVAGDYIFTINGIPASAISDEIIFTVVSGDKESKSFTYSVAEYFYERLYSDGIVYATEGKDAARKAFYETYLANGAAAQELFRNYDKDGNYVGGTTLVTDYNVLAVKDGVLANGKEVMLAEGEITSTVTANATLAADKFFAGKWTVTTYGDAATQTIANGDTVTSNGYVTVTPVYIDATGEYFLSSEKGSRRDYDTLTSISDTISVAGGAISISDGSLFFEDGAAQEAVMYVKYWLSYPSSYSCSVIEFDFKIDQVYGSSPISIFINGTEKAIYYTKIDNAFYLTMQDESGTHVKLGTSPKKWANIRIEHYKDLGKAKVYINNEFVMDMNWAYINPDSFRIQLSSNERKTESDANLWIDNVYVGHITKNFVAGDPKAAN